MAQTTLEQLEFLKDKDFVEKVKEQARIHAGLKEDFDFEEESYYSHTGLLKYNSFIEGVLWFNQSLLPEQE